MTAGVSGSAKEGEVWGNHQELASKMSDAALESFATIVKLVNLAEAFRGKSPSAEGGTSTRPEANETQNEGA